MPFRILIPFAFRTDISDIMSRYKFFSDRIYYTVFRFSFGDFEDLWTTRNSRSSLPPKPNEFIRQNRRLNSCGLLTPYYINLMKLGWFISQTAPFVRRNALWMIIVSYIVFSARQWPVKKAFIRMKIYIFQISGIYLSIYESCLSVLWRRITPGKNNTQTMVRTEIMTSTLNFNKKSRLFGLKIIWIDAKLKRSVTNISNGWKNRKSMAEMEIKIEIFFRLCPVIKLKSNELNVSGGHLEFRVFHR